MCTHNRYRLCHYHRCSICAVRMQSAELCKPVADFVVFALRSALAAAAAACLDNRGRNEKKERESVMNVNNLISVK